MSPQALARCMWASAIGTLAAVDYWRDQHHDDTTLSAATRWLFRVHTRAGRLAFTAATAIGAAVLVPHICGPYRDLMHEAQVRDRLAHLYDTEE